MSTSKPASFWEPSLLGRVGARLFTRILPAAVVGWVIYMIAMTVYDGALSLIFQPFIGPTCSSLTVLAAALPGYLLRLRMIRRYWHSSPVAAIGFMVIGSALFLFGSRFGLTHVYHGPELEQDVIGLHPGVSLPAYFAILFVIVSLPQSALARPGCRDGFRETTVITRPFLIHY